MRKQTKLVAVLSAAALFAIGASMTSFAAGWACRKMDLGYTWIATVTESLKSGRSPAATTTGWMKMATWQPTCWLKTTTITTM